MLGQDSKLDDWIQIIILVLIFGGSMLGAVAKKLIAYFSPKENQSGNPPLIPPVVGDDRTRPRQQPRPVARPAPTLPPARPAGKAPALPPVAKPWSPKQPQSPTRTEAPTLTDMVTEVFEQQRGDSAPAQLDTASVPQPPPSPAGSPPLGRPAPTAVQTEVPRIKKRRSKREAKRIASAKKQRSGQVTSSAAAKSDKDRIDPEKHLGHLHSKIEKQAEQGAESVTSEGSFRRPSREALRRAIIMSEILRPPLALRADDDTGF